MGMMFQKKRDEAKIMQDQLEKKNKENDTMKEKITDEKQKVK